MKAVILGDTHFGGGYHLGKIDPHRQINSRLIDYSNTFDQAYNYAIDNDVSHFVLTGDIYERRRPAAVELAIFSEKIRQLSEKKIHTHIVIGNHDLTFAHKTTTVGVLEELKLPYVHIYTDIKSVECDERDLSGNTDDTINFVFLPFRTRKMLGCSTKEESIQRLESRLMYNIGSMTRRGPKILVGHLMLEGTNISSGVLESPISELVLPRSMFKGLDAVVMGHIHPFQIIQNNHPLIMYIGSMERNDFGEGTTPKYFMVVEAKNGKLKYHLKGLNVRNLFDIVVDQTNAESGEEVVRGFKRYMDEFQEGNDLTGSIVRAQINIGEISYHGWSAEDMKSYLYKKCKINNCVKLWTSVISKRQLRKDTITERTTPLEAFNEYLSLQEDAPLKEKIRELGSRIINKDNEI